MASVQRHGRGYRIKVTAGRGQPARYVGGFRSKGAAELEAQRITLRARAALPVAPGQRLTLLDLLTRMVAARSGGTQPRDAWTLEQAEKRIKKHLRLGKWTHPEDMTPASIETWRTKNPKSVGVGRLLRALLNYAKDIHGQSVHPQAIALLRPHKPARRTPGALLTDQEAAAAQAAGDGLSASCGAVVHCLSTYGWRAITAAKMVVGDVTGDVIRCQIKGDHLLEHPLLAATMARLRPLLARDPGDPLFVSPETGNAWPTHSTGSISDRFPTLIGQPQYALKRYAISSMLERGMSLKAIQSFTGHMTISQLLRYARINEGKQREALQQLATIRESWNSAPAVQKLGPPGTTADNGTRRKTTGRVTKAGKRRRSATMHNRVRQQKTGVQGL